MRRSMCIILGLLALSLGVSWGQAVVAPADLSTLVTQDAGYIKTALAKTNLEKDEKSQHKIRVAALMIAQYAQSGISKNNPKNAALATLRDNALALRKAVQDLKLADTKAAQDLKFAEAKKLAETLSLDAPVNAGAKTEPVALGNVEDIDIIMKQFASARMGGFGLEDYLLDLKDLKDNPAAEDAEKMRIFSRKLALIGTLTLAHTPAKLDADKTLVKWQGFSKDLEPKALALAKAADGKSADAISKAAEKLYDNCLKCHEVFR